MDTNDCSIDPVKLNEYLSTLNDRNKKIVETVVDNTIYCTTQEMLKAIKRSLDKFHQICDKYILYIPNIVYDEKDGIGKIGSEHFILLQLKEYLHPIATIYGHKNIIIPNDYPILILDDAIYSSINLCKQIDFINFYNGTIPYQFDSFISGKVIKNKFYICTAYLSSNNVQIINDKYYNATVIADQILEEKQMINLFPDIDYMTEHFGLDVTYIVPLYFNHKVASEASTYQFYHQIIKNPINRKIIDDITPKLIAELIEYFNKL